ncbi:MAG: hypothetical protein QOC55_2249, partial [Thermoleophilaceae bacterium]|nr:hypothetical protein [Thermoleophilaceae bacterium]
STLAASPPRLGVQPAIWLLFLMKPSETGGSILPVNLAEVPV